MAARAAAAPQERWLTRRVWAWALYDVASSGYPALVATFFGLYFVQVIATDLPHEASRWGLLAALSLIAAGLLAPFVGALADRGRSKLAALATTTALCVVATAALSLTDRGDLWLAAGLFLAAQVGYTLATAVYDSLLVAVAGPRQAGRASGFGWALGLIGGIAALSLAILLVARHSAADQIGVLGQVFLLSGLLMGVLAVPALIAMGRVLPANDRASTSTAVMTSFAAVLGTLRQWRRHRAVFRMLLAYYLINDALVTRSTFLSRSCFRRDLDWRWRGCCGSRCSFTSSRPPARLPSVISRTVGTSAR